MSDDDLLEFMIGIPTGCLLVWIYLRTLYYFESPGMAAMVGIGLIGRLAWICLKP